MIRKLLLAALGSIMVPVLFAIGLCVVGSLRGHTYRLDEAAFLGLLFGLPIGIALAVKHILTDEAIQRGLAALAGKKAIRATTLSVLFAWAGFVFPVFVAHFFTHSHFGLTVLGIICGAAAAIWSVYFVFYELPVAPTENPWRPNLLLLMNGFAGGSMMTSQALTALGITGDVHLLAGMASMAMIPPIFGSLDMLLSAGPSVA